MSELPSSFDIWTNAAMNIATNRADAAIITAMDVPGHADFALSKTLGPVGVGGIAADASAFIAEFAVAAADIYYCSGIFYT